MLFVYVYRFALSKEVKVCNDQEVAQSGKKTRWERTKLTIKSTYTKGTL